MVRLRLKWWRRRERGERWAELNDWELPDERFFLTYGDAPEIEVTRDEWLAAERNAGFTPKPGCGPFATHSFGVTKADFSVSGRRETIGG